MATELPEAGYQDIRAYIEANWTFLGLFDSEGAEVMRIPVTDERAAWTHEPGAQTLELTLVIRGIDANFPQLPVNIAGSALYKTADAVEPMSVTELVPFTFTSMFDVLTIRHRVEVPIITG